MEAELFLSAGVVVLADRLSKAFVARRLARGRSVRVGSWLRVRCVENEHAGHRGWRLLLWTAALGTVLLVIQVGHFFPYPAAQVGLGAALGGAGSNLHDVLRRGAVIDFLDLGWWPVFNIADVAITLGIALALWHIR